MYSCISPGAIKCGPKTLNDALALCKAGGFTGLEINPSQIADQIEKDGAGAVKAIFENARVRPAAFGLPVDWRSTEENWKRDLEKLPRLAKAAESIGVTRSATWILPFSNERAFDDNRKFHIERFKPIAKILGDHGISLGLEFIGPKTLIDTGKFPFIRFMKDMVAMGKDIAPNVGLLLDCWHWYTSYGTVGEIEALKPAQVVYVHVNDAPRDVHVDKQMDNVRDLPGATGVIDIAGFLKALKKIGYDGPVTPEPFKNDLGNLPSDEARAKLVGESMAKIFALGALK